MQVISELKSWWRSRPHWRPVYSTHDERMFRALVNRLREAGIQVRADIEISESNCPLQVDYLSEEYHKPFYTIYVPEKNLRDAEELINYLN